MTYKFKVGDKIKSKYTGKVYQITGFGENVAVLKRVDGPMDEFASSRFNLPEAYTMVPPPLITEDVVLYLNSNKGEDFWCSRNHGYGIKVDPEARSITINPDHVWKEGS